mgnify:CR=1 FL=1
MTTKPIIEVKDLKKSFGTLQVLKGINTEVQKGEVVVVIGPSGSGKSTFLRCLNLLETPTAGSIYVDGAEITDPKCDINLHRQKMGMVFQQFNLFNNMDVMRNLTVAPMRIKKMPKDEAESKAIELLKKVGLADRVSAYPSQLSGGQKQRVAIARALCMEPDVLCFDEPTSALDPELTGEVLRVIRQLAGRRTTMIVVTHEMAFARDVADRLIFMDGGVIVEQGDPRQVMDHPRMERTRQFLSRCANT